MSIELAIPDLAELSYLQPLLADISSITITENNPFDTPFYVSTETYQLWETNRLIMHVKLISLLAQSSYDDPEPEKIGTIMADLFKNCLVKLNNYYVNYYYRSSLPNVIRTNPIHQLLESYIIEPQYDYVRWKGYLIEYIYQRLILRFNGNIIANLDVSKSTRRYGLIQLIAESIPIVRIKSANY